MNKPLKRLTRHDLNAIQANNRGDPTIKLLLNEIRAYRGVLNMAWQTFDKLPPAKPNSPFDLLRRYIESEECVKEQRADYERFAQIEEQVNVKE